VTLLASIPATVDAACFSVTDVDETDADAEADTDADADADADADGDDEADPDAAGELAATEAVGAVVLVELAASLIVSWWLNGCSSTTITITATAATAARTDHSRGARDRRLPPPGRRGGPGGAGGPVGPPPGACSNGGRYGGW
jgi:hypothetical protein